MYEHCSAPEKSRTLPLYQTADFSSEFFVFFLYCSYSFLPSSDSKNAVISGSRTRAIDSNTDFGISHSPRKSASR